MTLQMIRSLRRNTESFLHGSVFYNWTLRGDVPDRMIVRPVDPWPGNTQAGQWLCEGAFAIDGEHLVLRGDCWNPVGVGAAWMSHMHGFSWLRDLRALGGEQAAAQARALIENWIWYHGHWRRDIWNPDLTGRRIALWIALHEFYASNSDDHFQDLLFDSLIRQAKHLSRVLPGDLQGLALLEAAKGLLYAGLAFEGREPWIAQALAVICRDIDRQILPDGMYVSRSPADLLKALQLLADIRMALIAGGYPLPEKIQYAIDRAGPALRFFRYNDKKFGLFNGAQEGDAELMDCVLGQTGMRGKALQSLPCAGFERVAQGRTLIAMDCGKAPPWPFDAKAHAAPLAFEMSYGKERIFVNCGSHPTSEDWQDALRATAAHTTLTIDDRNACEIRRDGHMARKVRNVVVVREETKNACLLEASHDGYVPLNGITHRRRLYLTDNGYDLRGEDTLHSLTGLNKSHDMAMRFHVHPRVMLSLIQDGQAALLRLPSGIGWRFHQTGGLLMLEDSIYMGEGGRPRKTKQLAIYSQMTEDKAQIKWALQRETL